MRIYTGKVFLKYTFTGVDTIHSDLLHACYVTYTCNHVLVERYNARRKYYTYTLYKRDAIMQLFIHVYFLHIRAHYAIIGNGACLRDTSVSSTCNTQVSVVA
jgi:hypothetical protein